MVRARRRNIEWGLWVGRVDRKIHVGRPTREVMEEERRLMRSSEIADIAIERGLWPRVPRIVSGEHVGDADQGGWEARRVVEF